MSATDLIVYGMCLAMILLGIVVFRHSRRDRPMGAIAMALGLIGIIAYLTAEEGAQPPSLTTPTSSVSGIPADASPEP
ncbi:MAG: hypothetical protein ACR2GS_12305 [Thermomicrobiales bacterium]|jgi:bacteriorhodopsin